MRMIIKNKYAELIKENEALKKQIKRLESRSAKLGRELLMCKNELRNPAPEEENWKKYNKKERLK